MRLLAEGVPVDLEAALVKRHCGNAPPLMARGLGWDYAHKGAHRLWRPELGLVDVLQLGELVGVEPFFRFGGLELLERLPERFLDARAPLSRVRRIHQPGLQTERERAVQAVEQGAAGVSVGRLVERRDKPPQMVLGKLALLAPGGRTRRPSFSR
jgi:hypothetical protein